MVSATRRVCVAMNAFKDSLSARAACQAVSLGLQAASESVVVHEVPLADGGDGSLDVFRDQADAHIDCAIVHGPLNTNVEAEYVWLPSQSTVIIETAQANGLAQLPVQRRNPMLTSTTGCGQLLQHALQRYPETRRVLFCVGGSSTNDLGCGMASALGFEFFDAQNARLQRVTGADLVQVARIEPPSAAMFRQLRELDLQVLCDVQTVVLDATRTFGPQKGASGPDIEQLERGIENVARLLGQASWCSDSFEELIARPGGGAAGALAGGLVAFCGASLVSGIETIASIQRLEQTIQESDIVITGEGKIDSTSAQGKVPWGVAKMAQKHGKPCIAIAGSVDRDSNAMDPLYRAGITAAFVIARGPMTLEQSQNQAAQLLAETSEQIARTMFLGSF